MDQKKKGGVRFLRSDGMGRKKRREASGRDDRMD